MSASARPARQTTSVAAPDAARSSYPIVVTSTTFAPDERIPLECVYTACAGQNVSPQLSWRDFPPETRSFALTMFDPDAPTGSGFWHWVVFDMPPRVMSLDAGAGASETPGGGRTGYNDFGLRSYAGPCPPAGDPPHRYIFTIYALDVPALEGVGPGTTGATLVFSMRGHVLATGSLVGRFGLA